MSETKPFSISRRMVQLAYQKVKSNRGSGGVDEVNMSEKMHEWEVLKKTTNTLQDIAKEINPVVRGWINYYGKFYKTKMKEFMHILNVKLEAWAKRKYKKLRRSELKAIRWLHGISVRRPGLFAHWSLLGSKPTFG